MEGKSAGSARRRGDATAASDSARIVWQNREQPLRGRPRDIPRIKRVCRRRSEFLDTHAGTIREARRKERKRYSSGGSRHHPGNRAENEAKNAESMSFPVRLLDRNH